jgi:hypothetical protein
MTRKCMFIARRGKGHAYDLGHVFGTLISCLTDVTILILIALRDSMGNIDVLSVGRDTLLVVDGLEVGLGEVRLLSVEFRLLVRHGDSM